MHSSGHNLKVQVNSKHYWMNCSEINETVMVDVWHVRSEFVLVKHNGFIDQLYSYCFAF